MRKREKKCRKEDKVPYKRCQSVITWVQRSLVFDEIAQKQKCISPWFGVLTLTVVLSNSYMPFHPTVLKLLATK